MCPAPEDPPVWQESRALEDLLDQAREAVVAGDLARLATLTPKVEALADRLSGLDRQTATRLRQKADRNAGLLGAATRGVRAAQARMADISRGPSLTTYDSLGRKATLSPLSPLQPRRF